MLVYLVKCVFAVVRRVLPLEAGLLCVSAGWR